MLVIRVVAVSDSQGGIYRREGLDIPQCAGSSRISTRALKAVYCEGSVCNVVDHETITNEELLALDVDILAPAALENQITASNARDIKAKAVYELANGPTGLQRRMRFCAGGMWWCFRYSGQCRRRDGELF